jgi:hypothetical protein
MALKTKKHYLSNKELLKEIHNSKMTYCWIKDDNKDYHGYDIIIDDISEINDEIIQEAKENRAKNIQKRNHEQAVSDWERGKIARKTKPRGIDYAVDVDTIKKEDLVFRVMTFEHIPEEQRKKNPKTTADNHSKCNFPPFKHYCFVDGELTEVSRSHWQGGLDNGHFSVDHGFTTERLASMYIELCRRYSMRGNWRGYTYVDEMRGQALLQLTQIGLQFNEAKSQNPFAYYTSTINNSFTRVLNLEKRNHNIRDDILEQNGLNPSFTRTFAGEWEAIQRDQAPKED